MSHLTSDEMINAVEGTLEPSRRRHLAECADCTREVESLAAVLKEAQAIEVPEPSRLFWDHFSARVRTAIATEPLPGGGWWSRLASPKPRVGGWRVLVPFAAMAMVVIAVLVTRAPDVRPELPAIDPAADAQLSEESWTMVADLVGTIDLETADAAGLTIAPGTAELAALDLNAQEQQELGRLIRAELERAKS
jgi:hypothetical protein